MNQIFSKFLQRKSSLDYGMEFVPELWKNVIEQYLLKKIPQDSNEGIDPQVALTQKIRILIARNLFQDFKKYLERLPDHIVRQIKPGYFDHFDSGVQFGFIEDQGQCFLRLEINNSCNFPLSEIKKKDCKISPEKALGMAFRKYCSLHFSQITSEVQKKVRNIFGLNAYIHSEKFPSSPRKYSPEAWAFLQNFSIENFQYRAWFGKYIGYFTPNIQDKNPTIIGLVKIDGVYTTRLFYYSKSGGNWHGCPGIQGNLYSKGNLLDWNMSYENGTVVPTFLSDFFDILPKVDTVKVDNIGDKEKVIVDNLKDYWIKTHGDLSEDEIQYSLSQDYTNEGLKITHLLADSSPFAYIYGPGRGKQGISEADLQFEIANIPVGHELINNLCYSGNKSTSIHQILGISVTKYVFRSQLFGKSIIVSYSIADDNLKDGWIDRVNYENSDLTSWGFSKNQINAGIICTKPIEYFSQCPQCIQAVGTRIGESYIDIRPYIQSNPLIQKIKQLGIF